MKSINVALYSIALILAGASSTVDAQGDTSKGDLNKGEYLAKAADCAACHTAPDGQMYGGGLAFATPFGKLYSTNISSDKEQGIGDYTLADFTAALREGKGKNGRLYPAMPYTSYAQLTDTDVADLYAYFMATKPANQKNRDNDIGFPFNLRFGLMFWAWLNLESDKFTPVANKTEQFNRGKYLVDVLGHCGECHTTRSKTFGLNAEQYLMGQVIDGKYAPNITPQELARQQWHYSDFNSLFREGYSPKGTTFGGMFTLISHSSQHLTEPDMKAMVAYLLDQEPLDTDASNAQVKPHAIKSDHPGASIYMAHCAGCHGDKGQGVRNVAPAMISNGTLDQDQVFNTVAVLLKGIEPQRYSSIRAFGEMPGYENRLTDQELIDLINFLRASFTDQAADIDVSMLNQVKEQIPDNAAH